MSIWTYVLWTVAFCGLSESYVDKTVYQYLVDNGYSSFVQLLKETHQDGVLQGAGNATFTCGFVQLLKETHQDGVLQGAGPVTVFAPSNAAIGRMDPDVMATMAHSAYQKANLVKYHLINDMVLVPTLATGETSLVTASGSKIDVLHVGGSLILNKKSRVDSAPNNDIVCKNGVIQPIDAVLMSPLYSTDNIVATLIERDDLFQDFVLNLVLLNMTSLLEGGEYTLFAPVDTAFLRYMDMGQIKQAHNTPEVAQLIAVDSLKYYIVPGARTVDMLTHGEQLYTLHGLPLNISVLSTGTYVNHARIVEPDIAGSNGIIQGLDDGMFPPDLLHYLSPEMQQYLHNKQHI